MSSTDILREAGSLRLRLQVNNRFRLETLAALSRVFREHDVTVSDSLLRSVVFALPEELASENGRTSARLNSQTPQQAATKKQRPTKPQPPPLGQRPTKPQPPPKGRKPGASKKSGEKASAKKSAKK